ncbi:DUF4349 domain-containing protein [Iocasia frigidifontis]|uniref:Anti-sigma-W factor RsiW n=1 Tax=Iocasia fonsfrigidae TaxID=2682810 RepID=A0A8A7KIN6_9FIRM|nr:DUF4349 domain-containing protein [Iocasia fonsfrigidae]QTL97742.1 DUF4349 domain-containing protein [Iocasia fonsfrigidae]
MRHEKIKELLPLYIDNSLNKEEYTIIEKHLEECEECRAELAEYQENYNQLTNLKNIAPPEDLLLSIMNKINKKDKKENKQDSIVNRLKKYFFTPLRVPAGLVSAIAIIAVIALTFVLNNPGNNIDQQNYFNPSDSNGYGGIYRQSSPEIATQEIKMDKNLAAAPDNEISTEQRKIIKTARLNLEIDDIQVAHQYIVELSRQYNTYIADSREWTDANDRRFSWYQLRVPADNFNPTLEKLSSEDFASVSYQSISTNDVTEEYIDIDIRLENYLAQQKRYQQLLDKASTVEEILNIEKELNRVRIEIERLKGRMKYLDNQVDLSTIEVEFEEVKNLPTDWGIFKALQNALHRMTNSFYNMIASIGAALPYLLIGLLAYYLYKKKRQ